MESDIQAAIAKAVELRALHTALMHRLPSASPFPNLSAQDYPVFNPTYEDEPLPLPGFQQNRKYAESWGDYASGDAGSSDEITTLSDYRMLSAVLSTKQPVPSRLMNMEDHNSATESRNDTVLLPQEGPEFSKPRRSSLGDVNSTSSYTKCRPTLTSNDSDIAARSSKKSKNKGQLLPLSWLLPKMKRKSKTDHDPQPDDSSQMFIDVKKELIKAKGSRDAALIEVTGMRSSLGELSRKLEYLEAYCQDLKTALQQAMQVKISRPPARTRSANADNRMIGRDRAMLEDFLHVVSESRLSVKQFCRALLSHVQDSDDHTLSDSLNALLRPHRLSLTSRHSRTVLYHVEAVVNRLLHQDFENCVFRESGAPGLLDPEQERQTKVQAFVALRGLSWEEMLRKGTELYINDFSKFYDRKMGGIMAELGWGRPWSEALLQVFFTAAKCVWLVHLAAFSLDPPVGILRVEENREFEARYMDDVFADKRTETRRRVKVMVMPGFYEHEKVVRCKVLCRYKPLV